MEKIALRSDVCAQDKHTIGGTTRSLWSLLKNDEDTMGESHLPKDVRRTFLLMSQQNGSMPLAQLSRR